MILKLGLKVIFSPKYAFGIPATDLHTPHLAPLAGVGGTGLLFLLLGRESQEDCKVKP